MTSIIEKISGAKGAKNYHEARNPDSAFHSEKYRRIFEIIKKNRNHKILELGCGSGIYTKFLARDFKDVLATDIDPEMINIAKKNVKCKFLVADSTALPLKNNSFDLVIGVSIIHHIKNRDKLFKEIRRVLKPNGYFAFCEPNKLSPITSLFQKLQKEDAISRFEVKRLVDGNGLKLIAVKEILFRNPFGSFLSQKNPIENLVEKLHLGVTLLLVGQKVD